MGLLNTTDYNSEMSLLNSTDYNKGSMTPNQLQVISGPECEWRNLTWARHHYCTRSSGSDRFSNCAPCSEGRKRLFDQTSATHVSFFHHISGLRMTSHEPEFYGRSVWRELQGESFLQPSKADQTSRANGIIK
jgi:hypothetical protein